MGRFLLLGTMLLSVAAAVPGLGYAGQDSNPDSSPSNSVQDESAIALTLTDAIEIALVSNHELRSTRLNVDNARAQIREAWGEVMPQVNVTSSYTRNIKSANPFAGSDAGGLFQSLGFIDWLAYNERARTDDDPSTMPISFDEFGDRRSSGLSDAGIVMGGDDNPFAVPNQFMSGVTVEQTLYSGSAFAAIKAAERYRNLNHLAVTRAEQMLVDDVRRAYYQALLAESQASVNAQSVSRTRATMEEVGRRVSQGVAPKFQRLSAEVQLANLETAYVQAVNAAASAKDNLKLILGVPISQEIQLRSDLSVDNLARYTSVSTEDAVTVAYRNRPDLVQADLVVQLRDIDRKIVRAQYLPTVSAFANFNYTGTVPDNRSSIISDADDPFKFGRRTNSFFSGSYWQPSINGGFRLSWNLFNGFQTSSQIQQRQVALDQSRLDREQLDQAVQLEVEAALRNLRAAQQRILSQEQNVSRAELNYEFAQARLGEGVASALEEREASEQLDQSRLNYLQAVHDYLVAQSAFETAVGVPMGEDAGSQWTSY